MCYTQGNVQKYDISSNLLGKEQKNIDPVLYYGNREIDRSFTRYFDSNAQARQTEVQTAKRDKIITDNTLQMENRRTTRRDNSTMLTGSSIGQGSATSASSQSLSLTG